MMQAITDLDKWCELLGIKPRMDYEFDEELRKRILAALDKAQGRSNDDPPSATFKVGDTGKTRGGDDYEVVAVHNGWLWVDLSDEYQTYSEHGVYTNSSPENDLLPPKQKIEGWLVVCDDATTFHETKPDIGLYDPHKVKATIAISEEYE